MKKTLLIISVFIAVVILVIFLAKKYSQNSNIAPAQNNQTNNKITQNNQQVNSVAHIFSPPMDKAGERVTKKSFGIYITSQNSPVQPERFTGYHTGADFEIFPEELNAIVSIHAMCSGSLRLKEYANGYGGVAVEDCELDGMPITVIYGHLKLSSINLSVGDQINAGDIIAVLGANMSTETDGERKHLHLGIHRGSTVSILGYVAQKSLLSAWADPCLYVCYN